MKLQDFVNKYAGKFIEYHSFNPLAVNQCTDLANQWITEGLGLTAIIGTNAQDFPKKMGNEFTYTLNTPTGQPEPGDLMIFKSADGVGHISIHYSNTSLSQFTSFDQNYPTKSYCKLTPHNYTNVLGWMRAKGVTTSDTQEIEILKRDLAEQRKQTSNLQAQVDGLLVDRASAEKKYEECNAQRIEAGASADGFRKQFNDFVATLATKLGTRQETVEILSAVDTCITFEDKAEQLDRQLVLQAKEYQATITELETKLSVLKSTTEADKAKYDATILSMEKTIKDLKYSPITPIQTNSLWSIIKSIFIRS